MPPYNGWNGQRLPIDTQDPSNSAWSDDLDVLTPYSSGESKYADPWGRDRTSRFTLVFVEDTLELQGMSNEAWEENRLITTHRTFNQPSAEPVSPSELIALLYSVMHTNEDEY